MTGATDQAGCIRLQLEGGRGYLAATVCDRCASLVLISGLRQHLKHHNEVLGDEAFPRVRGLPLHAPEGDWAEPFD